MTVVQEWQTDSFREWTGQPLEVKATGQIINAPTVIVDKWSDAELAEVGLYRTTPFVPPAGKVAVGFPTYTRVGSNITETYQVADAPVPTAADTRIDTFKIDPDVQTLINKLDSVSNGAEIDQWLTSNVTNLAQARTVLGYIIKTLVLLRRSMT